MKLIAEALAVARAERVLFSDLEFEVGSGDALIVTGANGAGKSTLLKTVAGFLKPHRGRIELRNGSDRPIVEHCHYLAHENALKSSLTVNENLRFWQEFLGPGADISTALDAVGLRGVGSIPVGYLSAGQKRRIAIARLLVTRREIWLVDEPTAALDASSGERFGELLEQHLSSGGLVIAATHQDLGVRSATYLEIGGRARTTPA